MSKVFLACSMSSLSEYEYGICVKVFTKLIDDSDNDVFCEITEINYDEFQTPCEATKKDLKAIVAADEFVLVHMSDKQSSTLFELGVAYALDKPIKIYYTFFDDLPFMIKELDQVSDLVELILVGNLEGIVL